MTSLAPPRPPLSDGVVSLRAWDPADVPAIVAGCQTPDIARYTRVPSPYTERDARAFVANAVTGEDLGLAVVDAGDGRLLGSIGLRARWPDRVAELGYWVTPDARRRAVASRAAILLTRWALQELALERVELLAEVENVASQRVALAAGFVREGVLRSLREQAGARRDYVMFAVVRSDVT